MSWSVILCSIPLRQDLPLNPGLGWQPPSPWHSASASTMLVCGNIQIFMRGGWALELGSSHYDTSPLTHGASLTKP